MQPAKKFLIARTLDDGNPMRVESAVIKIAEIEQELEVHVHQTRDAFSALNVATHPVEIIGNTA